MIEWKPPPSPISVAELHALQDLVKDPEASPDTCRWLLEESGADAMGRLELRCATLRHPNCPPGMLRRFALDPEARGTVPEAEADQYLYAVLGNDNSPVDLLTEILDHYGAGHGRAVGAYIAAHPNVTRELLTRLAGDPDERARTEARQHTLLGGPGTSAERWRAGLEETRQQAEAATQRWPVTRERLHTALDRVGADPLTDPAEDAGVRAAAEALVEVTEGLVIGPLSPQRQARYYCDEDRFDWAFVAGYWRNLDRLFDPASQGRRPVDPGEQSRLDSAQRDQVLVEKEARRFADVVLAAHPPGR